VSVAWVTGAHGFIGRHLSRHLDAAGQVVCGIGHGVWPETEAEYCGVRHWVNGEIGAGNLDVLKARTGAPDSIFHLAGGSSVGASIVSPYEDFERTCSTTARLLEWVRQHAPATRVVAVSSAAVYGDGHDRPIREDAALRPYSPYGLHKRFMEDMCLQYARDFGARCGIVRLFSVYGPGLRKQLLWDACSRISRGETQLVFGGTGDETRDWTDVRDAVGVIARAATVDLPVPFVVNGATGAATSVRDILTTLGTAWGVPVEISFSGRSRSGDPRHLVADSSRLQSWGLCPWRDVRSGLEDYVAWFRGRSRDS